MRPYSKSLWKDHDQAVMAADFFFSSNGKPIWFLFLFYLLVASLIFHCQAINKGRNSIAVMKLYALWAIGYSWPNQASALQWCQHPLLEQHGTLINGFGWRATSSKRRKYVSVQHYSHSAIIMELLNLVWTSTSQKKHQIRDYTWDCLWFSYCYIPFGLECYSEC